jgi:hypothetical protein
MKRTGLLALLLLTLTACGPIFGQLVRMSEGVRSMKVTTGQIGDLKLGEKLLVVGPFAVADGAFSLCRGEDAANFATALKDVGLFKTENWFGMLYEDPRPEVKRLKNMTADQMRTELKLRQTPDRVLFATVLDRDTIVAPLRGVVMDVAYRLEFLDPTTGQSVIIEAAVKKQFADCIPAIAEALLEKVAAR